MSADPADAAEVVPLHSRRPWLRRGRHDPSRFATSQRIAFDGMNLHVGKSSVVHAVNWVDWIDDLTLPAPACRQGFAGHGAHGELRSTSWPVTCRRCRRLRGDQASTSDEPHQQALFPL